MVQLNRILVPIDFTKESNLALSWAVKLADDGRPMKVILLHVLRYPVIATDPVFAANWGFDAVEYDWMSARRRLELWRRRVPPPMETMVICESGEPCERIAAVCERENVDLVVMTTHGRHGLPRLVHPNLCERLARSAPCPVLVLHMNRRTSEAVAAVAAAN